MASLASWLIRHCSSGTLRSVIELFFTFFTRHFRQSQIGWRDVRPCPCRAIDSVRSTDRRPWHVFLTQFERRKKGKGSPYSITERRVQDLIPVLGRKPAGDVSHKPHGRLPLLSARPAITPATLKRAATSFAAW